jgi:hypothetical protein
MCVGTFGRGRHRASAAIAEEMWPFASGTRASLGVALVDRFTALNAHYLGDHVRARRLAERVLAHQHTTLPRRFLSEVPPTVSMRIVLSRILWLEGCPDQAEHLADEAVALSEGRHPFALCQSLGLAAIPVALWRGDTARAALLQRRLIGMASRHALTYWHTWAHAFDTILAHRGGGSFSAVQEPGGNAMVADLLATCGPAWIHDDVLARALTGDAGWCAAEVLRVDGEARLARDGMAAAPLARDRFGTALRLAHEQGATAWALRAACSALRLARAVGGDDASERRQLEAVLARFTEGAATADLVQARALLDDAPHGA